MRRVLLVTLVITLAACNSSNKSAAAKKAPTTTAAAVTTTSTGGPSTTAGAQTSGIRTVLSPIGLNIRAQASKTAAVLGTAARATKLNVQGHTTQGGGWYQVKGATLTGWISDNPTLSGAGAFSAYDSSVHEFSALYPATWTAAEAPPASVVFRAAAGGESVVVTTAATVAGLVKGRPGYQQTQDEQIVVCGLTTDLVTYAQLAAPATSTAAAAAASQHFLAQIHLALDAQHALGIDANFGAQAQLQAVRDIANSVTFPFPHCQQ